MTRPSDQSRLPVHYIVVSDVFPPAIGGSGELLANVYGRLSSSGDVTVVTNGPDPGGLPEVTAGCRVHYGPARSEEWGLLRPRALVHHLRRARRIVRASRPRSIVHCGRLLPEGADAMIARRFTGTPFVCWAHGEELLAIRSSREMSWSARRVVSRAALFFANSRNTASVLRVINIPDERIVLVYPGVDAARFHPDIPGAAALRARLVSPDEILLLCVGRLARRKGHDLVLHALARPGAPPAARFVIVGDGEERARLERMTAEFGLQSRVTFVGAVPAADLPAYFAAADIFVHPNRIEGGDFEGFGIVFLEAAAAGLPVIAGTTGGAPEAVADGETGMLVSGTDPDELQRVLSRLASDRALRRALGTAGRARVIREFSWDLAAARVSEAHHRVLAGDLSR